MKKHYFSQDILGMNKGYGFLGLGLLMNEGNIAYKSALQLNEKEKNRCSYPLRLDVYGNGCEHDCTYCYAREAVKMGGWNTSRNLKHPYPSVANIECIRNVLKSPPNIKPDCVKINKGQNWKQVKQLLDNQLPLRIGALTDCFQSPMESRTHAGLELLKILTETNYPAQIVTKSNLIAQDDYIEAMRPNQKNLVIQLSITTLKDSVSKAIEPFAPSTSSRLKALNRLIQEGFYTSVRINPLFPIFPDQTLTKLASSNQLSDMELFEKAKESEKILPIFSFDLVETILKVFNQSPKQTAGKHTLIAGFVRLTSHNLNLVSKAIDWQSSELKQFFTLKKKMTYYYSTEEIGFYYITIRNLCQKAHLPFSVCYDSDDNYSIFRDLWANSKDCCNALGLVEGFKKVYKDCC